MRLALRTVCLAALLLLPSIASADYAARTESRYYGTVIGTATVCRAPESVGVPAGWGGSCFAVDGDSSHASVSIEDVLGPPVQGYFDLLDADGVSLGAGLFCDAIDLAIPAGAALLRVYVDGPVDGPLVDGCGIGAAGKVTVTFS